MRGEIVELPTLRVLYATGNAGKFEEATRVFARRENVARARVLTCAVDPRITEIQGSIEEIARDKCDEAYEVLFGASNPERDLRKEQISASLTGDIDYLLTEDVSLSLTVLCGFPGPYVKPMLEAVRPDGLWNMMSRYTDRTATATCTVMVKCMKTLTNRKFSGTISGVIVPPRGNVQHGKVSWNSVFLPDGYDQTLGELSYCAQAEMSHRRIALEKFLAYFCAQHPAVPDGKFEEFVARNIQAMQVQVEEQIFEELFPTNEYASTPEPTLNVVGGSLIPGHLSSLRTNVPPVETEPLDEVQINQKPKEAKPPKWPLEATRMILRNRMTAKKVKKQKRMATILKARSKRYGDSNKARDVAIDGAKVSNKKARKADDTQTSTSHSEQEDGSHDILVDKATVNRAVANASSYEKVRNVRMPLKKTKDKEVNAESTTQVVRVGNMCLHISGRCAECRTAATPQWRTGPLGVKTLCNRCGVKYIGKFSSKNFTSRGVLTSCRNKK